MPTSCRRSSRSYSTRCSSRATTSSERTQSVPRCTSYRKASWTSSPRPAKWPPVSRTARISEVCRVYLPRCFSTSHFHRRFQLSIGLLLRTSWILRFLRFKDFFFVSSFRKTGRLCAFVHQKNRLCGMLDIASYTDQQHSSVVYLLALQCIRCRPFFHPSLPHYNDI